MKITVRPCNHIYSLTCTVKGISGVQEQLQTDAFLDAITDSTRLNQVPLFWPLSRGSFICANEQRSISNNSLRAGTDLRSEQQWRQCRRDRTGASEDRAVRMQAPSWNCAEPVRRHSQLTTMSYRIYPTYTHTPF